MGPTSRLFEIIQLLRASSRALPARAIAETLGVAKRTVYRDIATLQGMRIPIEGEAGIGYVMRAGFDLPPLTFTQDEMEAIRVGLSLLARTGDQGLQRAASRVAHKIASAMPKRQGPPDNAAALHVSNWTEVPACTIDLQIVRAQIRDEGKLQLTYLDEAGRISERTVLPIALAYFVNSIVLAAWCELRQGFRHFRIDRIRSCTFTGERFTGQGQRLKKDWLIDNPAYSPDTDPVRQALFALQ